MVASFAIVRASSEVMDWVLMAYVSPGARLASPRHLAFDARADPCTISRPIDRWVRSIGYDGGPMNRQTSRGRAGSHVTSVNGSKSGKAQANVFRLAPLPPIA